MEEPGWEGVSPHVLAPSCRPGWRVHTFPPSPCMSTYLLCVVVGQYTAVHRMLGQTRVSVHCPTNRCPTAPTTSYIPPPRPEEGVFAAETAVKCVDIFNKFFGLFHPALPYHCTVEHWVQSNY